MSAVEDVMEATGTTVVRDYAPPTRARASRRDDGGGGGGASVAALAASSLASLFLGFLLGRISSAKKTPNDDDDDDDARATPAGKRRAAAAPTAAPQLGDMSTGKPVPTRSRVVVAAPAEEEDEDEAEDASDDDDDDDDDDGDGDAAARWTAKRFRRWCAMKMGTGGDVVRWYVSGDVYEYPSGKLLARVEGLDVARGVIEGDGSRCAHQLSRKFFVFRDPVTNAVITRHDGAAVAPIRYPYQHITYRREGDGGTLTTEVTTGTGENVRTTAGNEISARRAVGGGGGGETASHTTPFAWCTPFLKDFSRRHSSPALPFQRSTGKTFD
jgi:hypothetical protein